MTWLAAFTAFTALAAPIDVERGRVALSEGRPPEALEHARAALAEDPDVAALRLYADALEAAGLGPMVEPELRARTGPASAAVTAWIAAERGEPVTVVPEGPPWVLAAIALARGDAPAAIAAAPDDPDGARIALEAHLSLGHDKEAAAIAKSVMDRWPSRLDVLEPLFAVRSPAGAVGKARKRAEKAIDDVIDRSKDPVALYRARWPLLASGDSARLEHAAEALVRAGEPRPRDHALWGAAMRRSMARGLALTRGPVIPDGDPAEMQELALAVAEALRDMGRVDEALGVFESVRARADSPELALAHGTQLLRTGRAEDALRVAEKAGKLASRPVPDDVARLDGPRWRHDLGAADLLAAKCLVRLERLDEAAVAASRAALLWPDADTWLTLAAIRSGLHDDEGAFAALAAARAAGADVDRALAGTFIGSADWEAAAEALAAPPPSASGPGRPADVRRASIGEPIPDFELTTADGVLSTADLRGQVLIVTFFASWCGPCKVELPAIDRIVGGMRKDGLPVRAIAVSVDERERDYTRFVADAGLASVTFGWAPALGREYRVRALPTAWIVDPAGVARFFHQGYTPDDDKVLDRELRSSVSIDRPREREE